MKNRGQRAVSLLKADLLSDNIAQAYIFSGDDTSALRRGALEFAKALNCQKTDSIWQIADSKISQKAISHYPSAISELPCNSCVSCRKIQDRVHPDIFILDFESQSKILDLTEVETLRKKEYAIDSIRRMIQSSNLTPVESKWKIFVIDGAELLSIESANALLKSLEEPSKFCCWILLTENFDRILPTVRSRCRKILFSPAKSEQQDGSLQSAQDGLGRLAEKWMEGAGDSLSVAAEVISDKKGKARGQAESFLEILALRYSVRLHQRADEKTANDLSRILGAQEELRRNVNPQFVLDAILTTLSEKSIKD